MRINKIFPIISLLVLLTSFSLPNLALISFAQQPEPDLQKEVLEQMGKTGQVGYQKGTPTKLDLLILIGQIINTALSFVGLIFFILLVYGGFLWATAGGNEEKVTKAKRIIKNGAIGVIVALSAYAISYFIIAELVGGPRILMPEEETLEGVPPASP